MTTIIERTFKLRVYERESHNFQWCKLITTKMTMSDLEKMIEKDLVDVSKYYYALDEY